MANESFTCRMTSEQRLIDANALIEEYTAFAYLEFNGLDFIESLKAAPTVDAVEVVRCENCKHFRQPSCAMDTYCFDVTEEGFCSYGEMSEGE